MKEEKLRQMRTSHYGDDSLISILARDYFVPVAIFGLALLSLFGIGFYNQTTEIRGQARENPQSRSSAVDKAIPVPTFTPNQNQNITTSPTPTPATSSGQPQPKPSPTLN